MRDWNIHYINFLLFFSNLIKASKVNASKSEVTVLNGEEGVKCEVHADRIHLAHVSEFKYLGCILDESSPDGA